MDLLYFVLRDQLYNVIHGTPHRICKNPPPTHDNTTTTPPMRTSTTPRSAFFAEDNLNLLLNVVTDTFHMPSSDDGAATTTTFDKTSSRDRTRLFEAMATVYRAQLGTQPSPSLSTLNKRVLKTVYTTLTTTLTDAPLRANESVGSSTIRDLDASQLPQTLPTAFPKFDAPVEHVSKQQTDAAMQRLRCARQATSA